MSDVTSSKQNALLRSLRPSFSDRRLVDQPVMVFESKQFVFVETGVLLGDSTENDSGCMPAAIEEVLVSNRVDVGVKDDVADGLSSIQPLTELIETALYDPSIAN